MDPDINLLIDSSGYAFFWQHRRTVSVDSNYRRVTAANSSRRQAVEASGKGDPWRDGL